MKEARALCDILAEYARNTGLTRRAKTSRVNMAWAAAAGPACAKHSRVAGVRQGVLHVTVDSAACLHEMAGFRKAEILASLVKHKGCGRIHDIVFRIGPLEEK